MKKTTVLSPENLPTRFPIAWTLVYVFALDKWNAPQWLWGAVGLLILLMWIGAITQKIKEKRIDIFKDSDPKVNSFKHISEIITEMKSKNKL